MFELRVTGYDEAIRLLKAGWPTHVVSVLVAEVPVSVEHLHIRIDDIIRPSSDLILPLPLHVEQVLGFTQNLTADDRLLVHCKSGINRSTAMAIAILIQHGASYREAFAAVAAQRPTLAPNRLLISYVDRHFALDGNLARMAAR